MRDERREPAAPGRPSTGRPARRPASGRSAELVDERDVLLASLEDLEREHAAGDLDDADYEALRAGYVARAARALRAIEALEQEAAAPGPADGTVARLRRFLGRRRSRRILGAVGAVCVLGIVAIAAAHLAGARLPGQDASGSISVPKAAKVRRQLRQASLLGSTGHASAAVVLYGTILREVPDQPEALTYRGWLVRLAGIADHDAAAVQAGDAELAKAVAVAPRYADARALDGMALLEDDGQLHLAVDQFDAFLADRPSHQLLGLLGTDMAAAYAAAHEPVPAALRPYVGKAQGTGRAQGTRKAQGTGKAG